MESIGNSMYDLLREIFPIYRSITGNGVLETLYIIARELPKLRIHEVPTGTKAFDWIVPREWNVKDAYVLDPSGDKIIDFAKSNLHLVGYSTPVNVKVSLDELQNHLYSLSDQPEAIPYVTSYYQERWGFCLTHEQREKITQEGEYTVVIDSELKEGHLTYAELYIPGEREEEVFLSTYICHPSLANEISGPAVTTFLARWLLSQKRKYSYRIAFIPETIGAIVYLSRNLDEMKRRIIAGYTITCVGDDRGYSFLPSRQGDSLSDRVALHVLKHAHSDFVRYTYLDRGSDERQYCAPGVDLPIASVMRSKYGTYPEYHTSLDDLTLVTPSGLQGAYDVLCKCIECIEADERLKVTVLGEPQLGKRGLYPTLSTTRTEAQVCGMLNLIAYCDGKHTLLEIADKTNTPMWRLIPIAEELKNQGLLACNVDSFVIGQKAQLSRIVTENDVERMADITGDYNPVHVNENFASQTRFGRCIAHGLFSAGLISAVLGTKLPGPGAIYLRQILDFLHPVHIWDYLTAEVEVTTWQASKRIITLETRCYNQNGEKVANGQAVMLVEH